LLVLVTLATPALRVSKAALVYRELPVLKVHRELKELPALKEPPAYKVPPVYREHKEYKELLELKVLLELKEPPAYKAPPVSKEFRVSLEPVLRELKASKARLVPAEEEAHPLVSS
jgi:hypothetical protein